MSATPLSDYLLLHLDRDSERPMYRQLYQAIRDGILGGAIAAGTRLPASRELMRALGVGRNTITVAYDQLGAEGYLTSRVGAGTFVADTAPEKIIGVRGGARRLPAAAPAPAPAPALSPHGAALVAHAAASSLQWGPFMPGIPDLTLFPHRTWDKLQRRHWRRPGPDLLTYGDGRGYLPLREAIAVHLRVARSVNCTADQIVVTTGTHQSIDLLLKLLGQAGDRAWIEDPCYWGTRNVLRAHGIAPVAIEVDDGGMQLDRRQLKAPPQFICVTPSHQYPLGPVMSLARRRTLLDYAAANGIWVVEDDYDSEFRYSGPPLASLQGMDEQERVLYLGTFSKTMFPGLRIGFIVVPEALAPSFAIGNAELYRGGQVFLQAVLADFIKEGHFASHIRRMRQRYAARLALLRAAIGQYCGAATPISGGEAGLHLVMGLPDHADDVGICHRARQAGILVRPLSTYYAQQGSARKGLVLGYACAAEELIGPTFARLASIIAS